MQISHLGSQISRTVRNYLGAKRQQTRISDSFRQTMCAKTWSGDCFIAEFLSARCWKASVQNKDWRIGTSVLGVLAQSLGLIWVSLCPVQCSVHTY